MKRPNGLASIIFFILGPGVVAGLVPWLITSWNPPVTTPYFVGLLFGLGGLVIAAGLLVLIDSFLRFVNDGRGTPMPRMPTEAFVATGPYLYVRNPMYIGVVLTILGQAILFLSGWTALYALAVATAFHLFVTLYEEPTLRRRFGDSYERYTETVRRWMPRIPPPADGAR